MRTVCPHCNTHNRVDPARIDQGPVCGADACRANADILDGALHVTELAAVPHPHRLVHVEHRAGDEVFDRGLCGKRYGKASDPEAGDDADEGEADP